MINLSRQERFLLWFLAALILSGITINYLLKKLPVTRTFYNCTRIEEQARPIALDLNKASQEELERLPGIGPEIASRIIEYRQTHGSFSDISGLRDIQGIGQKKLDSIKQYLIIK
jgi:competence protein ComEA